MREAKSSLFPLIKGERWRDRHRRRYQFNRMFLRKTRKEVAKFGVSMVLENQGDMKTETWVFRLGGYVMASWNPWSASALIAGYRQHLHDYAQAIEAVRKCVTSSQGSSRPS